MAATWLAWAKDVRTVQASQEFCQRLLTTLRPPNNSAKDAWWLSIVVYLTAMMRRSADDQKNGLSTLGRAALDVPPLSMRLAMLALGLAYALFQFRDTNDRERLRGSERQRQFALQRQRMLLQASPPPSMGASSRSASPRQSWKVLGRHVATILQQSLTRVLCGGPHAPAPTGTHEGVVHPLVPWLTRLMLGTLCCMGTTKAATNARIVSSDHPQRLIRVIGLLLVWHTSHEASCWLGKRLLQWCLRQWQRRQEAPNAIAPAVAAAAKNKPPTASVTDTACGICQQRPLQTPSCPVACGHLFCWSCLQQWLPHAPVCPQCRAPCTPQQVLVLHNY